MKLKKIVALGLSLILFTANITPVQTVFADNKKEVKKEKVKKDLTDLTSLEMHL